jgi:hypothetical protein
MLDEWNMMPMPKMLAFGDYDNERERILKFIKYNFRVNIHEIFGAW